MNVNSDPALRGRKLVRHYIYSIVLKNEGRAVCIPSSREISAELGVARSTVRLEVDQLVLDGILQARHGVGTFSVPRGFTPVSAQVGIIVGGGDNFNFTDYSWTLQSAVGNRLVRSRFSVKPVFLYSAEAEGVKKELRNQFIDCLVWIKPPPWGPAVLRDCGLKGVFLIESRLEEFNSASIDYAGTCLRVGRELLAEGRRRFAAVGRERGMGEYLTGFRRAGLEIGEDRIITEGPEMFNRLRQMFRSGGPPDSLLIHTGFRAEVLEVLRECGVDLFSRCRVITSEWVTEEFPGFSGWCYHWNFDQLGKFAARSLSRQLEGDETIEHEIIQGEFHKVNL